MTTPPPDWPPLCDVMEQAWEAVPEYVLNREGVCWGAVIRAVRDYLIQWSRLHDIDQEARNAVYRHLTAEAQRAEQGDA